MLFIKSLKSFLVCTGVLILLVVPAVAQNEDINKVNPDPRWWAKQHATQNQTDESSSTRQQRCERRQQAVNRRVAGIQRALNVHLKTMQAFTERVQQFVSKQNLQIVDYDQLLEAVNQARATAEDTVTKVNSPPYLNCNHDDNRADVMTFRDSLHGAIDATQKYRQALKELLVAVKHTLRTQHQEETR